MVVIEAAACACSVLTLPASRISRQSKDDAMRCVSQANDLAHIGFISDSFMVSVEERIVALPTAAGESRTLVARRTDFWYSPSRQRSGCYDVIIDQFCG